MAFKPTLDDYKSHSKNTFSHKSIILKDMQDLGVFIVPSEESEVIEWVNKAKILTNKSPPEKDQQLPQFKFIGLSCKLDFFIS